MDPVKFHMEVALPKGFPSSSGNSFGFFQVSSPQKTAWLLGISHNDDDNPQCIGKYNSV